MPDLAHTRSPPILCVGPLATRSHKTSTSFLRHLLEVEVEVGGKHTWTGAIFFARS